MRKRREENKNNDSLSYYTSDPILGAGKGRRMAGPMKEENEGGGRG
jgi:hypothetical protein